MCIPCSGPLKHILKVDIAKMPEWHCLNLSLQKLLPEGRRRRWVDTSSLAIADKLKLL